MQWLSNFYQSFYSARLAYPQNFTIFGSKKLKIRFKQFCMHSKTLFKFLFNSSKISTSCAHVIFFLNTRLHCDSTKIWITSFGSTHLELQNSQNSIQTGIKWTGFWICSHWRVGPACQQGPLVSETEQRRWHATARRWSSSPTARTPATPRTPTCSTWWGEPIGASGKT